MAEELNPLPKEQKTIYKPVKPAPIENEIPLHIIELEERLNNLKRPLPAITHSPWGKITDPEQFIQSHLATIKANMGNRTFTPFTDRLNSFIEWVNS